MEVPASPGIKTLPLALRLRRAVLVALLLGLWAPVKIVWEQEINRQQDFLRFYGAPISQKLSDQLGQGATIGVLGGLRSIVADFLWLNVTTEWMKQRWFPMASNINIVTTLQPHSPIFWDMGGWELAWNASIPALSDPTLPDDLHRLKASRFWLDRGIEVYQHGIENNPLYWRLWYMTGMAYDQRLKDYDKAAFYYQKASESPNAPIYIERFSAIMADRQHAQNPELGYARWKALWERLTPAERAMPLHEGDRIEKEIRLLEEKLSIPKEKRVFPN